MIVKIHKRGSSFKTGTAYILHDIGGETADRVMWSDAVNVGEQTPDAAWRDMYETWDERTRLKREAGVDLRGRDNQKPVLHYTLSWAPGETPTPEHMKEAALSSLIALKLGEHQAVMAAHNDKDHLHVHIMVNTVHPETGRTASLKYSRMELSRWAEAYEREHGIQCQQRIDNNALREAMRDEHRKRIEGKSPAELLGIVPATMEERRRGPDRSIPYSDGPIFPRERPTPRDIEYERFTRDIVLRMKRLNAEISHRHMVERDVTWSKHRDERNALREDTKSAFVVAAEYVQARFRSRWTDLYEAQREENRHLARIQMNPAERAIFVIKNSERLGNGGPLSLKDKKDLIASPTKLFEAVDRMHIRERRLLSNVQKVEIEFRFGKVTAEHDRKLGAMKVRQEVERAEEREVQKGQRPQAVSFPIAREQLLAERFGEIPPRHAAGAHPQENDPGYTTRIRETMEDFYYRNASPEGRERMLYMRDWQPEPQPAQAPEPKAEVLPKNEFNVSASQPPPFSRAEQIVLDNAAWRARNPDKDFDREM